MNPDVLILGGFLGGAHIQADMAGHLTGGRSRRQDMILTPAQTKKLLDLLQVDWASLPPEQQANIEKGAASLGMP